MQVAMVPIGDVRPYERNPRKTDKAVPKVAASLKEFGWRQPIVVDPSMTIVVGHVRWQAAKSLGMTQVPVHIAENLTPGQIQAYRLADNRTNEEAEWADDLLRLELSALQDLGLDLSITGFDDTELSALLADQTQGLTDPDDVPEAPQTPVSVHGDCWILGKHRLVCGDATSADDVALALNGVQPHLMVTDPPYGIGYDPSWHVQAAAAGQIKGAGKRGVVGLVENDDRVDWTEAWALFPGDVAYVWHASMFGGLVAAGLADCGFSLRSQIVWAKASFAIGRGHYHWQHETCWYVVKEGRSAHWSGDRSQSTVWHLEKKASDTGHGTQKPVECMKRPVENNSSPGQAIYDPFLGSGTTIIAAEMTGRACHAIEISEQYVDVAVQRWEQFTGKEATLESTGKTYKEMAAERLSEPPPSSEPLELAS